MPVIFDDDILIPPSMRSNRLPPRRYYETTTIVESSNKPPSTIGFPPYAPEVVARPRSPLVIHREETTKILPIRREIDVEDDYCSTCSSDVEFEFDTGRRGGRRYYAEDSVALPDFRRRRHSLEAPLGAVAAIEAGRHIAGHEYDKGYRRGRRDSKFDTSEGEYYVEDGSRRNFLIEDVHHGPHILPFHNHKDTAGYNESPKHHKRAKRLAQAGLTVAALGAAKELYDHRRGRSRSRSRSPGHRRSRSRSHNGRDIAAAALGATAAGLAAHKFREHRRHSRSRSRSVNSPTLSDNEHHKKAKIAAATAATIGGAALAAHHIHKRRESRAASRSRSRSISRDPGHDHTGRNLAAAALGGTAAGLAHHHYKHHRRRSNEHEARPVLRRSHSESSFHERPHRGLFHKNRSPSPNKHDRLKKGAALAAAAVIAKEALNHYRATRSRSRSNSRSPDRHRHRRPHSPHGSRSPSPHHRGGIGHRIAQTVAGAIEGRHSGRSRRGSVSEGSRHHGGGVQVPAPERQRHMYASDGPYPSSPDEGDSYADTASYISDTDSDFGKDESDRRPCQPTTRARLSYSRSETTNEIDKAVTEKYGSRSTENKQHAERRRLGYGLDPEHTTHKLE